MFQHWLNSSTHVTFLATPGRKSVVHTTRLTEVVQGDFKVPNLIENGCHALLECFNVIELGIVLDPRRNLAYMANRPPVMLPNFSPARLRSIMRSMPFFTRICVVLILAALLLELQSITSWSIVQWGALIPMEINLGTSKVHLSCRISCLSCLWI